VGQPDQTFFDFFSAEDKKFHVKYSGVASSNLKIDNITNELGAGFHAMAQRQKDS